MEDLSADSIKISIIVPVYKVEKYVDKCLQSLENQSYTNTEIILIDDGSPDKSGDICEKFAEGKDNIFVIHQDNAGVSVARNNGIDHATGEYILFVDPDDWLEETACERLIECIKEKEYDIVFFLDTELNEMTGEKISRKLDKAMELNKEDIRRLQYNTIGMNYRIFKFHSGTPWGKLFKREFIEKNKLRFTPGVVKAQDVLFDTQAYEKLQKAYVMNYAGYVYRKNEGSSNIRYNPKIVKGTFLLIEGLGKVADQHEGDVDYQKAMAKICMYRINFIERLYMYNKNHVASKRENLKIYHDYLSLPSVNKYIRYYERQKSDRIGDIIRQCLFKKNTLKLYYYFVSLRYKFR